MVETIVVAVVLLMPLIWLIVTRNSLVSLRNHIRESSADIEVELQRRHDLIPNLVATVKAYAAHEQSVLEQVTALRNRGPCSREEGAAERELRVGVDRLLALAEAYPDLKADERFAALQRELVITEDRLAASRRFFNGNVRDYRNACEQFPSSLVASVFAFPAVDWLTTESSVRAAPQVVSPRDGRRKP